MASLREVPRNRQSGGDRFGEEGERRLRGREEIGYSVVLFASVMTKSGPSCVGDRKGSKPAAETLTDPLK